MPELKKQITYLEDMNGFENPPIGTIVQWFPQANLNVPPEAIGGAMVTGHEGPGVLSLTIWRKNANPLYNLGVRYMRDPFHKEKREQTMMAGGWDYMPYCATQTSAIELSHLDDEDDAEEQPVKRHRGRPRKLDLSISSETAEATS